MLNSKNYLKNMKVKTKLGLVILCMAIPIISLVAFLLSLEQKSIRSAKVELYGVSYINRSNKILRYASEAENLIKIHKSTASIDESEIEYIIGQIDNELKSLSENDMSYGKSFQAKGLISEVSRIWSQIREGWKEIGPISSSELHNELQATISKLALQINDKSSLRLDPETNTSMLIDIMTKILPDIMGYINDLQELGTEVILRKVITFEEEGSVNNKISKIENGMKELDDSLAVLFQYEPNHRAKLTPLVEETRSVSESFLDTAYENLIEDESLAIKVADFYQFGKLSHDKYSDIYDLVYESLIAALQSRIDRSTFGRNMQLLIVLMLAGLAILVSAITYRYITSQIISITEVFDQIDKGDFEARAQIYSSDELGTMTIYLNEMLDRTLSLIQSQDERDAIQESIMKLLDEVSDVAKGDLTVEAEVTEDVTGAIADSFNHMIYQLRQIVLNVQDSTLQVSSSASYIQATAEQLADGSSAQAEQIIDSSAALDEMAVSIQQVSENASLSSTVAEQALANAKQGTNAVQNTIQGMQRIRSQVQETAKRIKRLGERSQEISEIVQLIGDIADRTSILALNASIQAARAGEAGRSFAVVAEEVERLAERSTNATKQISSLVNTIQSETNEAVIAMEESTREVVQGSQVADKAGQALNEIESVSSRLAELIQSISLASTQQARGSDNLSKAMNEISEVTQHTASGTKQTATSISQLASLADDLRNSVSTFRLPVLPEPISQDNNS